MYLVSSYVHWNSRIALRWSHSHENLDLHPNYGGVLLRV